MMATLHCSDGNHDLPLSEFTPGQINKPGTFRMCKVCRAKRSADQYARNRERVNKRCREWYSKHREHRATLARVRKYGITRAALEAMGSVCEICQSDLKIVGAKQNTIHVDHNHATGEVRGILCGRCNTAVGMLKDDPALARRAAAYLEKRKEVAA